MIVIPVPYSNTRVWQYQGSRFYITDELMYWFRENGINQSVGRDVRQQYGWMEIKDRVQAIKFKLAWC
jgi:hypothetical protein